MEILNEIVVPRAILGEILTGRFPDILNCILVVINKNIVLFDLVKSLTEKLTLIQVF